MTALLACSEHRRVEPCWMCLETKIKGLEAQLALAREGTMTPPLSAAQLYNHLIAESQLRRAIVDIVGERFAFSFSQMKWLDELITSALTAAHQAGVREGVAIGKWEQQQSELPESHSEA